MDRATELRKILADSGSVTFVKSGQALSLRGDLVKNREYVKELEKLQARDEEGRQTRARLLSVVPKFHVLAPAFCALHLDCLLQECKCLRLTHGMLFYVVVAQLFWGGSGGRGEGEGVV